MGETSSPEQKTFTFFVQNTHDGRKIFALLRKKPSFTKIWGVSYAGIIKGERISKSLRATALERKTTFVVLNIFSYP